MDADEEEEVEEVVAIADEVVVGRGSIEVSMGVAAGPRAGAALLSAAAANALAFAASTRDAASLACFAALAAAFALAAGEGTRGCGDDLSFGGDDALGLSGGL